MPDAKEKTTLGDTIIYKTAGTLEQVVDFYNQQMTAAGWKLEGEPTVTGNFTSLTFSQNGKKAMVNITSEGGETNVIINVTKQ